MKVYQTDPISDARWSEFLQRHPRASVFHTAAWLEALRNTYGYEPIVFTTSPPKSELKNALVFCRINSWLTGLRLVSLPFSDHCEPLCDSVEDWEFLIRYLQDIFGQEKWKYIELRPIDQDFGQKSKAIGFQSSARYFLHTLSLQPDAGELFRSFDKDSVQRRIERAERAGLIEKCGTSDDLLQEFYNLFVMTRGRHHLPPIPYAWFENLIRCLDGALEIRVAYKDRTPIAAILTAQFRDVVYFKYGCSKRQFNKFGATPWLLWKAMLAGKSKGARKFDMGRTQDDHAGLLKFKNHWSPHPQELVYWKYPHASTFDSVDGWRLKVAKGIFSCMPGRLRTMTGRLIYRHFG
jgi:hypothetical protein